MIKIITNLVDQRSIRKANIANEYSNERNSLDVEKVDGRDVAIYNHTWAEGNTVIFIFSTCPSLSIAIRIHIDIEKTQTPRSRSVSVCNRVTEMRDYGIAIKFAVSRSDATRDSCYMKSRLFRVIIFKQVPIIREIWKILFGGMHNAAKRDENKKKQKCLRSRKNSLGFGDGANLAAKLAINVLYLLHFLFIPLL